MLFKRNHLSTELLTEERLNNKVSCFTDKCWMTRRQRVDRKDRN